MTIQPSDKILRTKKQIMAYLDISSEEVFKRYIQNGLPATVISGRWIAHKDNLDDYFKAVTRRGSSSIPEDAE